MVFVIWELVCLFDSWKLFFNFWLELFRELVVFLFFVWGCWVSFMLGKVGILVDC